MAERAKALESALSILDYGCDEGPWDKEAEAVRAVIAAADAFSELLAEMAENGAWNPAGITWKVFEDHPGWPRKAEEPAEAGSRTTDKQDG